MNNIEHFDQLRETAVILLRNWAEFGGLFPKKELNVFFYWFTDKGHRRIAAQQLVIECITAFHGSELEKSLDDLQDRLYKLIDAQDIPLCNKISKNRQDAENWLKVHALTDNTLQETTEVCQNDKHTKIYVLDLDGRRVQCVTICPGCWSMAEDKNMIR